MRILTGKPASVTLVSAVYFPALCYIYYMTITQIVEIPANRRLTIDVPREVPAGATAHFELKVIPFDKNKKEERRQEVVHLLTLRGSCKGLDTMDAYFARKRADRAFENGQAKGNPYRITGK